MEVSDEVCENDTQHTMDMENSPQLIPSKRERKRKCFGDEDEEFALSVKKDVKRKPLKKKVKKAIEVPVPAPKTEEAVNTVPVPPPTLDISTLNISQAIYKALDEIIDVTSLLDYTHVLGALCKVYWDGENDWYYARILAYDSASQLHFIYYDKDNTCEWISFNSQPVLQCSELVVVQTGAHSHWPAMHFITNDVGDRELSQMPGYKKGQFVEFFSEVRGKGEYGYYGKSAMKPYTEETPIPKGKSAPKRLIAAHTSAREEVAEQRQLREQILIAARQKLLFARRGVHAIGLRVKGSSFVLPSEKNSIATRKHEYSIYDGVIQHYSAGIDKYMIVFDDSKISPQWLTLDDVTLVQDTEPTSAAAMSCSAASVGGACGLCRQRHNSSDVAHGSLESIDPHMLQCSQCKEHYHSYCMPEGLVAEDIILTEFRCWKCIRCLGCLKSAFDVTVTSTSLKSLLHSSMYPDNLTLLCSRCINQYSTTHNFCPICYKLYEEEKPLGEVGAPVEPPSLDDEDAQMVQCSECYRWVHAMCEGIDAQQYIAISNGTHPVWGDEYLCPLCRLTICKDVLMTFSNIDKEQLFAEPVSVTIAKNYYEIIKTPMDLKTMKGKAQKGTYKSLQALRQDFELMCLNAAVFNKVGDYYFNYTRDYFNKATVIFDRLPHRTTMSANGVEFNEIVNKRMGKKRKATPAKTEEQSVTLCPTIETPGVNTSNEAVSTDGPQLPTYLSLSPFAYSCLPVFFSYQSADVAIFTCLSESCVCCGSAGNNACLLFCADCGECYHYYCVDAPIHSMSINARQSWRCMNCSLCCECHSATSTSSLLFCEKCDRAYHMDCLSPSLSAVPSTSFVCKHCVTCSECSPDEITGKKFFKSCMKFWGCSSSTCIRCEITKHFQGKSRLGVDKYIRLPSNCNVCSKKCVAKEDDDHNYWRTCRLCFSPVHDACDSRYSSDVLLDDYYYICQKCFRSRMMTDIPTHLGSSEKAWQVLQKVSSIQQNRLLARERLQEIEFAKCGVGSSEQSAQWHLYEGVIVWAHYRCQVLLHNTQIHQSLSSTHSKKFTTYPFLYYRASRFVRLLKKESFSWHDSLLGITHGRLRVKTSASIQSISRLAMMAAAFISATTDEVRKIASHEADALARLLHPPSELIDKLVVVLRGEGVGMSIAITNEERIVALQKLKVVCDFLRSAPLGYRIKTAEEEDDESTADMTEREQVQCVLHRIVAAVSADGGSKQRSSDIPKNNFRYPLITRPIESRRDVDSESNINKADEISKPSQMKRTKKNRAKESFATLDDDGGKVLESISRESHIEKTSAPSICDSSSVTSSKKPKRRKNTDASPKPMLEVATDDATSPPTYEKELAIGHCGDGSVLRNVVTDDGDSLIMWATDTERSDAMDIDDGFTLHVNEADTPQEKIQTYNLCQYRDPRYCIFCHMPESSVNSGESVRMLQYPDGVYAHVNCVRCSSGVIESDGALESATICCTLCGETGAFLGCINKACKKTFHVSCAAAYGCVSVNIENKQCTPPDRYWATACPLHIDELERKKWLPSTPHNTQIDVLRSVCIGEMDEESTCAHHAECATKLREGFAVRFGALTILQLGTLRVESPHFHDEHVVYPVGFRSMRLFWSMKRPYSRTVYSFEVLECADDANSASVDASQLKPVFRAIAADDICNCMISRSIEDLFDRIISGVRDCNKLASGQSLLLNRTLTTVSTAESFIANSHRNSAKSTKQIVVYGLNAYQFFGVGSGVVRQAIEQIPDSVVCMTANFYFDASIGPMMQYKPAFVLPKKSAVFEIFRKQAQLRNIRKRNLSGCARAEGRDISESNAFTNRITNLAKAVDGDDDSGEEDAGDDMSDAENTDLSRQQEKNNRFKTYIETCYKELAEAYHQNPYAHLEVRRSQIHGWGLYATTPIPSDTMIVEYLGEKIRQVVADERETMYEREGVGSCYMFRLDRDSIIDATHKGGIARFMNHCCQPNAYARIISTTVADDTETKNLRMSTLQTAMCAELQQREATAADGDSIIDKRLLQSSMIEEAKSHVDKHIVIMAARDIKVGEEITYDYKFPIEDVKLVCYCGAPGCSGSMN